MSFAGGTWLAGNSGQPAPPILDAALLLLLLLLLLSSRLIMLVSAGSPWSASLGETLKDTLFAATTASTAHPATPTPVAATIFYGHLTVAAPPTKRAPTTDSL